MALWEGFQFRSSVFKSAVNVGVLLPVEICFTSSSYLYSKRQRQREGASKREIERDRERERNAGGRTLFSHVFSTECCASQCTTWPF